MGEIFYRKRLNAKDIMQFVYLIISYILGKRNPLYYLIFPLALSQGSGALIDTRFNLGFDIFLKNNSFKTISFIYLIVVFFILKEKFKIKNFGDKIFHCYSFYIILLILLTLSSAFLSYKAINTIGTWTQMIVGFYCVRYIYICSNRNKFYRFINVLILISSIQSILYVLNSSKIVSIFDPNMVFQELDFGNSSFNRDFGTFPILGLILYLYSFANIFFRDKNVNRSYTIFLMFSYTLALLLSFTRTLLGIAILIMLVIFIVSLFVKKNRKQSNLKNIVVVSLLTILLFVISMSYFGDQVDYLLYRFTDNSSIRTDGSYIVRIQNLNDAINTLSRSSFDLLFGGGLNQYFYNKMALHGSWMADTTIPVLLIHTGFIGVVLYFVIEIFYTIRLIPIFFKEKNPLIIVMVLLLLTNMASETFAGGRDWGDPLIFHYFAISSYLIYQYKNKKIV